MGLIGRVTQFVRGRVSQVEVDPGAPVAPFTSDYASAPGDDSPPLEGDWVLVVPGGGGGRSVAVGYADTANAGTAAPGEKRLTARDSGGAIVIAVWLRGDGSLTIDNGLGSLELGTDGTWTLNGAQITPDGDVVTSDGVSLRAHLTPAGALLDSLAGPVTGVTGPPVPS